MSLAIPGPGPTPTEELPFRIRPLGADFEHNAVRELRHLAYARHEAYQKDFVEKLLQPDALELAGACTVLGAFDSGTDALLGTVRLTSSRRHRRLLPALLPALDMTSAPFTFIDRFAVAAGAPKLIAPALMKALWLWSLKEKNEAFIALAIRPLVRYYAYWGNMHHLVATPFNVPEHLTQPVYLLGAWTADTLPAALESNYAFWEFLETDHLDIQIEAPTNA